MAQTKSEPKIVETASEDKAAESNALAKTGPANGELVEKRKSGETTAMLKQLGFSASEIEGFEQVQTGGVSKWLNLRAFQEDPNAAQNKAVNGNGKAFAGLLLGRQEIVDEEGSETNADGVAVRYFYTLRLISPCPVTVKNEEGHTEEQVAQPGEIINVGERHALKALKEWSEDGGQYIVAVRPHSRIKVAGSRTMWTFDVHRRVMRPPMRVKAELVSNTR